MCFYAASGPAATCRKKHIEGFCNVPAAHTTLSLPAKLGIKCLYTYLYIASYRAQVGGKREMPMRATAQGGICLIVQNLGTVAQA